MTAHILSAEPLATASETLLESKRHATQRKEDLKQAKTALKLAEKTLKRARKESRKASKLEVQAQKQLDDLRRKIKKTKTHPVAKPARAEDASEPESPPATGSGHLAAS